MPYCPHLRSRVPEAIATVGPHAPALPSAGGRDGARLFAGDAIGTDVFAAPPHPVFAAESAEITLRSGTLMCTILFTPQSKLTTLKPIYFYLSQKKKVLTEEQIRTFYCR